VSEGRRHDALAAGSLAAILTLLFLDVILGYGVFFTRDVALYHFPLRSVLTSIVRAGEFPWWNPFISAGQPLAANPAYQLFYPPNWLGFLPAPVYAFQWTILLHVYLAAFGMYALLRSFGTSRAAAFVGALSFALGGFVVSTLSLLPFLFSGAWLPLTCLFTRRFLLHRLPRDFTLAAICLTMQLILGEPVTVVQTALLLGLYALSRPSRLRDLGTIALIGGAALLASAVQTLPMLDLLRHSVRAGGFAYQTTAQWSTPPGRLPELAWPVFPTRADYGGRGPYLISIYSGLFVAIACLGGLATRVRGWLLFLAVLATSVVFALGDHTPLLRLLHDVGVFRSLRFPEKFLLMGMFASIVFAAIAFDRLLLTIPRRSIAVLLCSAFVLADLAPRLLRIVPRERADFYTSTPDALRQLAPPREPYRIFHAGNWTQREQARAWARHPERYVIERNALSGYVPAAYGVRSAMNLDYDLTHLRVSGDFARAIGELAKTTPEWLTFLAAMSNVRYVATYVPPESPSLWSGGLQPAEQSVGRRAEARRSTSTVIGDDARRIIPIRFIEGSLTPRYYFATRAASSREFVTGIAGGRYEPTTAFTGEPLPGIAPGRVLAVRERANGARIEVETEGQAFLVMSVTAHKYWRVTIDGRETRPLLTNLAYQGVAVPPGRHVVEMRYRNPLVLPGAVVSLVTLIALMVAGWRR
jgi:hypothetical protein